MNNDLDVFRKYIRDIVNCDTTPKYDVYLIEKVTRMYNNSMIGKPVEVKLQNENYFIIGDIHGDFDSFKYLLKIFCRLCTVQNVTLIFLGDFKHH